MSITYSFSDNITYGTDDINNITKRLCGAGVAPFPAKDTYNVSDLNSLTAAVVGQGVALDGCRCTAETLEGENKISVAQGIVYFENGAVLEVDHKGYTLNVPINTPGYVYAYFSSGLQTGDILFAEMLPTDGYAVPLAQIMTDNSLRDCRSFACSKVATIGKNATLNITMERVAEPYRHNDKYVVQRLSGVDLSKFNYAAVTAGDGSFYFPEIRGWCHTAFFSLNDNENKLSLYYNGEELDKHGASYFYMYSTSSFTNVLLYIEVIGTELCLLCNCDDDEKNFVRDEAPICRVSLM